MRGRFGSAGMGMRWADSLSRSGSSVGGGLLVAAGLAVALAALGNLAAGPEPGGSGARISVRVPDPVVAIAFVAVAVAVLLFLGLLVPGELKRRRRRKGEKEFELSYEPPRVSPWVTVALVLLVVALLAAVSSVMWPGAPTGHGTGAIQPDRTPLAEDRPADRAWARPDASARPPVSVPAFTSAVAVFVVLGGVVCLALVAWLYAGDRLARWWAGPIGGTAREPLMDAVREGLDDLRTEPDARVAIMRCYQRFEQALARARVARAVWQTPTEFMRTALARVSLPHGPVVLLTGLFEVARFSNRSLGPTARDAACDCLADIGAALEKGDVHAGKG